jgi:hypothetical protein
MSRRAASCCAAQRAQTFASAPSAGSQVCHASLRIGSASADGCELFPGGDQARDLPAIDMQRVADGGGKRLRDAPS